MLATASAWSRSCRRVAGVIRAVTGCRLACLRGWLSAALTVPWSLALPLADRRGTPDRLAAYPAVGRGHLSASYVCADGRGPDLQVVGYVACRPPVAWQRLGHGDRLQRSRCLVAAGAFGPDNCDRDSPCPCFGYHVGGAAVSAGRLTVPDGKQMLGPVQHGPAGLHVRVLVGLDPVEAVHAGCPATGARRRRRGRPRASRPGNGRPG